MNEILKQFKMPNDEASKAKYNWAKTQVEVALEQGMSREEASALYQYVVDLDVAAITETGNEEVHATFRRAIGQATAAMDAGQPLGVALNLFRCIMHGDLKSGK
ncbi:hypothetical protein [uncultured Veillonella sp.]|uniref:hypothetical protein n=1 Tax=uncultured Veillonella sp. TaxID=159268 RepID=UPI0025D785CE|nr:hypothetical protein [uncultured Veillonella sp.]MDY3973351.1 hypothetical protein [Veillonella caviae]